MKLKYSEPKIEIRKYEISDIISASGDQAGAETNGQAQTDSIDDFAGLTGEPVTSEE